MNDALAWVYRADDSALRWLNSHVGRSRLFDNVMSELTTSPLFRFGVFAMLFVWLWFSAGHQRPSIRTGILKALAAGIAGLALGRALALLLPFRERPFARADLGLVFWPGYDIGLRTWSSLPSDHAVMGFALATGLWSISRRLGVAAYAYVLLLICLPRAYMGLHHPSDLLVGALLGVMMSWAMGRSSAVESGARRLVGTESRRPQAFYAAGFMILFQVTTMFESLRQGATAAFKLLRPMV